MGFEWLENGISADKSLTVRVPARLSLETLPPQADSLLKPSSLATKVAQLMDNDEFFVPGSLVLGAEMGNISDRFVLGKELGRGHIGVVRECEEMETGRRLACKSMNKSTLKKMEDFKELQAEICVMHHLAGQPHVVQLVDIFEDDKSVHVLMELCRDGDLFDYISRKRRLPEAEAARIFRQIVLAVQSCHNKGVIHRDLKPENVLFSKMSEEGGKDLLVKLADFGLAVQVKPGQLASGLAGSPFYMAPELVRRRKYRAEVDIWSLGVVLYTCISGFLPFWGKTHEQTFAAVCRGEPDLEKKPWQLISPEAKSLVRQMLVLDPKKRATLEDILNHPWILAYCPKSVPHNKPKPLSSLVLQFPTPAAPADGDTSPTSWQPMQQALSAPKGRFSPPGTPSPRGEQRPQHFTSMSQFLPTPPGTPKDSGQPSISPFAAGLGDPFKFFQHLGEDARESAQGSPSDCAGSPQQTSGPSDICEARPQSSESLGEIMDGERRQKSSSQDSALSHESSFDLALAMSPRSPLDKASGAGTLQRNQKSL